MAAYRSTDKVCTLELCVIIIPILTRGFLDETCTDFFLECRQNISKKSRCNEQLQCPQCVNYYHLKLIKENLWLWKYFNKQVPTAEVTQNNRHSLSLVFIYRNSSAMPIVGGHWRVKCFVLPYKFSSPVATNNTSPMNCDELR